MNSQRDLFDTGSFSSSNRGMWLYRKTDTSDTAVRQTLARVPLSYGVDCMVYTDHPDSLGAWNRLKRSAEKYEGGLLLISSLPDIARTVGGVADEVVWITEHNLEVVVMDCPATYVFDKPQINGMVFHILAEVWDNIMSTPAKKSRVGRKAASLPDNWEQMYSDYKAHKMKSNEFASACGYSAGTLFTKIKAFGKIADGRVDIFPTRNNSKSNYIYL